MKIISWNVNGIRSTIENGFFDEIFAQNPDILCIQEVKSDEIPEVEGYFAYLNKSEVKGNYATAVYSKTEPLSVKYGFGDNEFDREGRVIRLEYDDFYLFDVYAPSGAASDERLERKFRFYDEFTSYIKSANKSTVVCGDFNRISAEIDAKNPEKIKNKSGFLPEEQEWFKSILKYHVDAFRKFNSEGDNYTWFWNDQHRKDNIGYRFDYFLVSKRFASRLFDSYILKKQKGSDHLPIVLEVNSCPVCGRINKVGDEYCNFCGITQIESEEESVREEKLEIPSDKIILLDLNYTLIANSKEIFNYPLDKKIQSQEYENDLIELIKDNYVILITASPYKRSFRILQDIKEKTGFVPDESYWNFGGQPPQIKKYWMEEAVIPKHGDDMNKYLAIESNPATRRMYEKLGVEARPKSDFI